MSKIKLGDIVQDTITGYRGTATARYEFLNGCIRFCVERGKPDESGIEELTFDVQRLEKVGRHNRVPQPEPTGGARPDPPRTGSR